MEELTQEKLFILKRLIQAATADGVKEYLKFPGGYEHLNEGLPIFARILMYGIDNSMEIIQKKLEEREGGFDWDRDAPLDVYDPERDPDFSWLVGEHLARLHGGIRAQAELVLGRQHVFPENPYKLRKYGPDNARGRSMIDHRRLMAGITAVSLPDAKMFFLVPKNLKGVTLKQVFEDEGNDGREIYMYLGYSNSAMYELARDKQVEKYFKLYHAQIRFDHDPRDPLEWWEHLARLQIVFVALSMAHYKYKKLKPKMLVNYNERSLMSNVFGHLWMSQREKIIGDIRFIVDNPESVFCLECDKECEMLQNNERWHIALNRFFETECEKPEDTPNTFMDRHDIYQTTYPTLEPIYENLLEVYFETNEFGKDSVDRVIGTLDKSWNSKEPQEFTSYLIVIVDDVKAKSSSEKGGKVQWSSPEELFKEQEVFAYVGFTKENRYRKSNFLSNKQGLARLLTVWSRVFLVRCCTSTDILAVAFDEAFIYVLLKEIGDQFYKKDPNSTFYLVNKRSEARKMFGTSDAQYNTILDFMKDPGEVFNPAVEQASIEQPGVFAGRCGFEEITNEIEVDLAPYDEVVKERKYIMRANRLGEKRSSNRVIAHILKPVLITLDD